METVCILTALLFIANGLILKYYPPKRLTWWANGIKLPFATKTVDSWREANRYLAMQQVYFGIILFLLICLFMFIPELELTSSLFNLLIIGGCGGMLAQTRSHIKRHFDENGNRK